MKLQELGEDAVVATLTRGLPLGPQVRQGAGDDCAVIGLPRDAVWRLLKTDAVVEGIHFLPGEKMARVGWKALCRAISDVAAMGGVPKEAVVTVAAPGKTPIQSLRELYRGLQRAARQFEVSIVGGETTDSPGPLFISVALTGEVERQRCVLRSGGKPGDALFVTGRLGGSLARKHLDFTPRLAEARWLTQNTTVHAMMDLSDGLGSDLPRLAEASGCGFELWGEHILRTRGCTVEQALCDGEDYELLLAVPQAEVIEMLEKWTEAFPRLPLIMIGRLHDEEFNSLIPNAYEHFA